MEGVECFFDGPEVDGAFDEVGEVAAELVELEFGGVGEAGFVLEFGEVVVGDGFGLCAGDVGVAGFHQGHFPSSWFRSRLLRALRVVAESGVVRPVLMSAWSCSGVK